MAYEIYFLVAATLLFFLDLAFLSRFGKGDAKKKQHGFYAAIVGFALILTSYLVLLNAFTANDFSFSSVYSYSSSSLPLLSKIYASWAGAGGSMLFLTFLSGLMYLVLRFHAFRKADKLRVVTCQMFGIILIVFLVVCLIRNPFDRMATAPLEGKGLNPQLQTFWMTIHPPVVFSAYAFVLLAYALVLASMRTGRELNHIRIFEGSVYAAWSLLTLGIVLGGVWAYEVLGWGGYWAWDPVETASLLPWLFLTAYFHIGPLSKHKRSLTRESMILITFASLVFLTALARGGFTTSVHSYAMSPVGPIMLVFALAMVGYFLYLGRMKRLPFFKLETDRSSLTSRSAFIGFWALILIAAVCFIGLAFADFAYNYWTFPFVIIFVAALIGCSMTEETRFARLLLLVTGALLVGLVLLIIGFPAIHALTIVSLPLLILALSTSLYRLARMLAQKSFSLIGRRLLHFGIIVLLIGVFISAGVKTTSPSTIVEMGTSANMSPLTVELSGFTISNSSGTVYNEQLNVTIPEHSTVKVEAKIQYSGKTYYGSIIADFYPNYGLVLRPLIISTETGDIYLHFDYSDSLFNALTQTLIGNDVVLQNVQLIAQFSPLIYLVWAGAALMIIGILSQSIVFLIAKNDTKQRRE